MDLDGISVYSRASQQSVDKSVITLSVFLCMTTSTHTRLHGA